MLAHFVKGIKIRYLNSITPKKMENLFKATSLFKIFVAPANCLVEKFPKGKQR